MGDRGAAERAALWFEYLAEEIFQDKSQWSIAAGCVGTRTGLRGQKNRCDLDDFVRHLWQPSAGNDKLPDKKEYVWNNFDVSKADEADQEKVAEAIDDVRKRGKEKMSPERDAAGNVVKGPDGKPKMVGTGKFQLGGKVGKFTNLLNTMNINGQDNYFDCMKKIGEPIAKVKEALEGEKDDKIKKKIQGHVDMAQAATDRVIYLREMEMGKNMINGGKGAKGEPRPSLKDYFENQEIKTKKITSGYKDLQYEWPDKEETCKDANVQKHFGSKEKAEAAWDKAMADLTKADDDGAHQKAANALKESRSKMTPKPPCA